MEHSSAPQPTVSGWQRWGARPVAAALLVLMNGLYMALVAFGNITDFDTNQEFVQHVLMMDTTNFGAEPGTNLDPDVMWRAIESTAIQNIAYVAIIIWEALTALVLLAGGYLLIRTGNGSTDRARSLATIGLLMLIALFFGGFIAIGGEWFQMWKSSSWNGIDAAFRNSVLALGTLILVHLPSPHWNPNP